MEMTTLWTQLALWAVPIVLSAMMALVVWSTADTRKCGYCCADLETISEDAQVYWWHTSVSYTFRCPSCGQISHGTHIPVLFD